MIPSAGTWCGGATSHRATCLERESVTSRQQTSKPKEDKRMTADIESTPIQNSIFLNDGSYGARILRHCVDRCFEEYRPELWGITGCDGKRSLQFYRDDDHHLFMFVVADDGSSIKVTDRYRTYSDDVVDDPDYEMQLVDEYCDLLNKQQSFFNSFISYDDVNTSSVLISESVITESDVGELLDWNREACCLVHAGTALVRGCWAEPEEQAASTCAEFETMVRQNFAHLIHSRMPSASPGGE